MQKMYGSSTLRRLRRWEAMFDPLNQGDKGAAKPLEKKTELSPEEKLREMEKESGLKGLHPYLMNYVFIYDEFNLARHRDPRGTEKCCPGQ